LVLVGWDGSVFGYSGTRTFDFGLAIDFGFGFNLGLGLIWGQGVWELQPVSATALNQHGSHCFWFAETEVCLALRAKWRFGLSLVVGLPEGV
jgi:hypothetical protein